MSLISVRQVREEGKRGGMEWGKNGGGSEKEMEEKIGSILDAGGIEHNASMYNWDES